MSISNINNSLYELKNKMSENITILLRRGEQLEEMEEQSEMLEEHARTLQRQCKNVKKNEEYKWGGMLLTGLVSVAGVAMYFTK